MPRKKTGPAAKTTVGDGAVEARKGVWARLSLLAGLHSSGGGGVFEQEGGPSDGECLPPENRTQCQLFWTDIQQEDHQPICPIRVSTRFLMPTRRFLLKAQKKLFVRSNMLRLEWLCDSRVVHRRQRAYYVDGIPSETYTFP